MRILQLIMYLLLILVSGIAAASPQLQEVRLWSGSDRTRVVLGINAQFEHEVFMLDSPARLVIDLPHVQESKALPESFAEGGVVKRIRTGTHDDFLRVVLDLTRQIEPEVFTLSPNGDRGYRLVLDLEKGSGGETQSAPTVKRSEFTRDEIIVAVDAGHGGKDPGAIGPSGTREKVVVMQIARDLADMIDAQPGMRAVLTRKGDVFLTLRERLRIAQKVDADLFVSVHANAARVGSAEGSSVYALSREGATSEHARWLAHRENKALLSNASLDKKDDALASFMLDLAQGATIEASLDVASRVLTQLSDINDLHKQTVQQAAFVVLKSPDIPSILVETAFITNRDEARQLQSQAFQDKLAQSVLQGITSYFASYRPNGPLMAKREHEVSRGETLSEIAVQYDVSRAAIRRANDMESSILQVGQELVIPMPGQA